MGSISISLGSRYGLSISLEIESQDFDLPNEPDVTLTRVIFTVTVDVAMGMAH